MVEFIYHLALEAYHFAVNGILWPVVTWSILALLVMRSLYSLRNQYASVQFYTSFFTLLALPVGILLYNVVNLITAYAAQAAAAESVLRLVVYPSIQTTAFEPTQSMLALGSLPFIAGCILVAISLISFLAVIRIFFVMGKIQRQISQIPQFHYRKSPHIDRETTHKLARLNRPISVKVSAKYHIPFTSGWQKPVIVIPDTLLNSPQKLNMTLQHEIHHIQRNDFLINLTTQIIRALFFFHPLVHRLARQTVDFMEISCDQHVITQNHLSRKQYAHLLYDFWPFITSSPAATIRMACSSSNLKRRIKAMEHSNRKIESPKTIWTAALSCFLAISMVTACSQVNEPQTQNEKKKTQDEFVVVEKMPTLKGGLQGLMDEINYPESARKEGIEGKVLVQFSVSKEGSVEGAEVVRGINEALDQEALRVVKQAEFTPGYQKGEKVRVRMTIPIVYKLGNADTNSQQSSIVNPHVDYEKVANEAGEAPKIKGVILDAKTEEPVRAANISIGDGYKGASSNNEGNFFISNLDEGDYTLEIDHPSYLAFRTRIPADPGLRAKIYIRRK